MGNALFLKCQSCEKFGPGLNQDERNAHEVYMGRKIKGKFTFMNTNIEQNKLSNLGVLKCLSIYTNERFS